MQTPQKLPAWLKDFLRVWVPSMVLVSAMLLAFERYDTENRVTRLEERHRVDLESMASVMHARLGEVERDVLFLASSGAMARYTGILAGQPGDEDLARQQVLEQWEAFVASRPALYDQIRYLDLDGRERMRINVVKGQPEVVPANRLQLKADRYYTQEARLAPPNQTYRSRLDLNVENGQVEEPFKPMLRLVRQPLNGTQGDGGLVVLNYKVQALLDRMREYASTQKNSLFWLLDKQGHWILSDQPAHEWGSQISNRNHFRLDQLYPTLAAVLREQPPQSDVQQVRLGGGLYTYLSIAMRPGLPDDNVTLSLWTSADTLLANSAATRSNLWLLWVALSVMLGTGSYLISRSNQRRLHAVALQTEAISTLEEFINAAPDALIVSNENGRIVQVNQMAERMFGYQRQAMVGLTIEALVPVSIRDKHPGFRQSYLKNASSRPMGQGRLLRAVRQDGSDFPVAISLNTMPSTTGIRVISAVRDMSTAEHDRRQLAKANAELEAFSYSVSHDLRAPLRAVDGFSKILLSTQASKLDDEGRDLLNRMRAAAQRMGQLIDDMLMLSRISRAELHLEVFDISAVATQVVQQLREAFPEREVAVTIQPGLMAKGDPKLVRIVLDNLLGNAWKFSGKTEQPQIDFGQTNAHGLNEFFVRDNGAGYDMAYAQKLFVAFQRLHDVREFEGTGIGLATVARVVNMHGGTIRSEGAVGQGATFWFTLSP